MGENQVVVNLIDFSKCDRLRSVLLSTLHKRVKQLEYLSDLRECNDQYCIREFLQFYILDGDIVDLNFMKELISIDGYALKIYPKYKNERKLIYCKNFIDFMNISDLKISNAEEAMEILNVDLLYYFYLPISMRITLLNDVLKMEKMNRNMLSRLDLNLISRSDAKSLIDRGIFNDQLINRIKTDRELCLKALLHDRNILGLIHDCYDWYTDKEALDALINSKVQLYLYRPILKILKTTYADNLDFVWKIIEIEPKSFEYASERVRSQKDLAMKILDLKPSLYTQIHPSLLTDREIQLKIIRNDPTHFYRLPKHFKTDKEFIVTALRNSEDSATIIAENVPTECLSDEDVINAMIGAGQAQYLDVSKLTRDQVLKCVNADGTSIRFFENYMEDVEIVRCATRQTLFALGYIPKKSQTLDLILQVLEIHPDALNYIPKEFRKLDLVIETAIRSPNFRINTIAHLPKDYIYPNEEILSLLLFKTKGKVFPNISQPLSRSLLISTLKIDGKLFSNFSTDLQKDPYLLKTAIKHGYKSKLAPRVYNSYFQSQ